VSTLARHVVLNVQRSAVYAPTPSRATARLPNKFVSCAQTFATGAHKNVLHRTWITASAAPRLVVNVPQHAAK
jgi:hypothetical protein